MSDQQLHTALHVIADMIDYNNGHLPSTEADLMFREEFCDFGESPQTALRRMLSNDTIGGLVALDQAIKEEGYLQ